jgi:ribose 5-phosphate isomerase B
MPTCKIHVKSEVFSLQAEIFVQSHVSPFTLHYSHFTTMKKKQLITEKIVLEAYKAGKKEIEVVPGTLITPLARDTAKEKGIRFIENPAKRDEQQQTTQPLQSKKGGQDNAAGNSDAQVVKGVVAIGSDHGGFQLKEQLKKFITELGYEVMDVGTASEEPCDYPDFAYAVAHAVASKMAWRGIMIDGAGIGSCMVANKVPGIRAACCMNEFVARNSREHNDANVLTLGSRVIGNEVAKEIVRLWLQTWFGGGRHAKRVQKIMEVEQRFVK